MRYFNQKHNDSRDSDNTHHFNLDKNHNVPRNSRHSIDDFYSVMVT